MLQSLLDLFSLVRIAKNIIYDNLLLIIKKIFRIVIYLIKLRWILDILSKFKRSYIHYIYESKYYQAYSVLSKILLIFGLTSCLLLKFFKNNQLYDASDEKDPEKDDDKRDFIENLDKINNETGKVSEERWKD